MSDKSELLEQLRIERPTAEEERGISWVAWTLAIVAGVAVAGGIAWYALPHATPISVATAEPRRPTSRSGPARSSTRPGTSSRAVRRRCRRRSPARSCRSRSKRASESRADEIIARLDDTNARAALRAGARSARAIRGESRRRRASRSTTREPTYQRNEQQLAKAVISEQTFDTAKAAYDAARTGLDVAKRACSRSRDSAVAFAERNLDDTIVRAPFAGIVTVKAAQEGEMVSPISAGGGFTRTGIGTIVDMDSLEIEVDVSENFINRVHPDQAVTARLNAYPDWKIPGARDRDHPDRGPRQGHRQGAGRLRRARRPDPARDGRARRVPRHAVERAGESASAGGAQRAFLVPTDAVQANGDTGVVFVLQRRSRRAPRGAARRARRGRARSCCRVLRPERASRRAISRSLRTERRFASRIDAAKLRMTE